MKNTFQQIRFATLGIALLLPTSHLTSAAEPTATLDLWPGRPPGQTVEPADEKVIPPKNDKDITRITDVTRPSISVYKPPKEKDTGAAVVICPGGGYHILAIEHEGEDIADWFNSIGVTGIILKYRVPWNRTKDPNPAPLQDAQRAMRLARQNAEKWNIDPQRIGMLGFSAGGNLTGWAGTNFDSNAYDKVDEADELSCRPDFLMLIYPAYFVDHANENHLDSRIRVNETTPPAILIQTEDDSVNVENSIYFYLAMKHAKVPAEMHIYPSGGHGYGLRKSDHTVSTWPDRAETWMRSMGFLKK